MPKETETTKPELSEYGEKFMRHEIERRTNPTTENGYGQTYATEWTCDNCTERFTKHIARGQRRPTEVECPNCGCMTDGKRVTK